MTTEQSLYESRIDSALNEVLSDLDSRLEAIEERKRVWVEERVQRELVKLIDREAA